MRRLIVVEPTKVTTKAGVTRNGTLRFTVLPPQNVIAHTMRKNWQNWKNKKTANTKQKPKLQSNFPLRKH